MNKLDMAMQILLALLKKENDYDADGIAGFAFEIADAMQNESDKREPKGFPEALLTKKPNGECAHFHTTLNRTECFDCGEVLKIADSPQLDWQPDWSQAPDWANWWCMHSSSGQCYWTESEPVKKWDRFSIIRNNKAPSFDYQGVWQQSLRKRPQ